MTTNVKRHFLDCCSLAEMAITLVVVSVMLILPTAFLSCFLGFILGLPKYIALSVPPGLWLLSILAMWCWFVRIGRSWPEPRLATREFSYFQWTSIAFVLFLSLAFPSEETISTINALHWFLTILFVMVHLAYVSLAIGIKTRPPKKIIVALLMIIAVAVLPIWMK